MHWIFYLSNVFVVMPFSNSCLRGRLVRWYFYNEAVARPAHVLARLPHLLPSYHHPPPPLLLLSLSTLTPLSATLENTLSLTHHRSLTHRQPKAELHSISMIKLFDFAPLHTNECMNHENTGTPRQSKTLHCLICVNKIYLHRELWWESKMGIYQQWSVLIVDVHSELTCYNP